MNTKFSSSNVSEDSGVDYYCNDWFVYTIDRPDGTSTQLLANRDGSFVLIHPLNPYDRMGVFTPQQYQILDDLLLPEKTVTYRADRSRLDTPKFGRVPTVMRCLMWVAVDQSPNIGCWVDSNLSPTARTLFTALDRILVALSVGRPNERTSSLLRN